MSYSAATTFDAALLTGRKASTDLGGRALRLLRNGSILGLGALTFIGVSGVVVTVAAGLLASRSVEPQIRLSTGPASLALIPHDQITRVARGQGDGVWADAFIDRSKPILPADKMRPMMDAPQPAPLPTARMPAIPMPRPMPARLAQMRADAGAVTGAPLETPPVAVAVATPPQPAAMLHPLVAGPALKPDAPASAQSASKLNVMANLDPRIDARKSSSEPKPEPKPAPVATIPGALPDSVSRTAVYDIVGSIVHMPDGSKLEAHSGLGDKMDDPRHIKIRMRGPTPPNVYVLTEREALFHGVRAIRLNPVDEDRMFGRDGMLAHTYMLGPNGQSNGCVSFKDYKKFLTAFLEGKVDKLVVVADLKGSSWKTAALQADGIPASGRRFAGGNARPRLMPRDDDREERGLTYTSALGFAAERGAGNW